jgi:hypothetical protein
MISVPRKEQELVHVRKRSNSKRKANEEIQSKNKAKKQMKASHQVTDEDFRTSETQQIGMVQPLGITAGQIPLSNVERWRLRGWRWQEAMMKMEMEVAQHAGAESPTGTKTLWMWWVKVVAAVNILLPFPRPADTMAEIAVHEHKKPDGIWKLFQEVLKAHKLFSIASAHITLLIWSELQ